MCGIFGAIGKDIDYGAVRTLALANAERGNEAIGFFGSDGKIWKRAQSPIAALMGNKLNKYLAGVQASGLWSIVGHTRHGTRGQNTRENAHPFRYGNIVGAHNGIVDAPNTYAVDSMYLIDALSKAGGDYQKALQDISGYWGLVWGDGQSLYLQAHNNSLAVCKVGESHYFSSDHNHLRAALGNIEYHAFTEGETLKYDITPAGLVEVTELPDFDSKARHYAWDSRTQGKGYTYTTTTSGANYDDTPWAGADADAEYTAIMGLKDKDPWNDVPDYEERWAEAWAEYVTDYAD